MISHTLKIIVSCLVTASAPVCLFYNLKKIFFLPDYYSHNAVPTTPGYLLYHLFSHITITFEIVVFVISIDINQPSLSIPFYSVLVSVSAFTLSFSTVFHSINSHDNSLLSHSVLHHVLFLPYWSYQPNPFGFCLYYSSK